MSAGAGAATSAAEAACACASGGGGTGGRQHDDAHAVVALAAARVEAGVLRARGGRQQARGQARVAGRRLGRGAQVGRRRGAVAAPLGRLLGPQPALHQQRRAGRHRHAALLRLRLCARSRATVRHCTLETLSGADRFLESIDYLIFSFVDSSPTIGLIAN